MASIRRAIRARPHQARRAAAEVDGLELAEARRLGVELRQQRVEVRVAAVERAGLHHERAVPAAARAERQVHVEVADAHHFFAELASSPIDSTDRNASCGTSTRPTCFMRFLPSFWRSSSLRLRLMSPP